MHVIQHILYKWTPTHVIVKHPRSKIWVKMRRRNQFDGITARLHLQKVVQEICTKRFKE